jgi:Flp pilus assembly pilin Flp
LAEKFIAMINGAKDVIGGLAGGFSSLGEMISGTVSDAFDSVGKKITWVIDKAKQA